MPLDTTAKPEIVHSVCPHDCPSTCALEVERLGPSPRSPATASGCTTLSA
jgi:hypothetical protein